MTKKLHPADAAAIEQINSAVSFNVHLRLSPTAKINEPATSLREAAEIAARIASERKGRTPLIYAITETGASHMVPKAMIDAALADPVLIEAKTKSAAAKKTKPRLTEIAEAIDAGKAIDLPSDKPAPASKARRARAKAQNAAPAPAGKRAAAEVAAQAGVTPSAPDFSANTHKPFRKKLEALIALADAGDIEGLRAFPINPVSSSPKAMDKYRRLAIIALEARADFDKADSKLHAQLAG